MATNKFMLCRDCFTNENRGYEASTRTKKSGIRGQPKERSEAQKQNRLKFEDSRAAPILGRTRGKRINSPLDFS